MLRKYPNTLRWRQVVPPLFVLALISLGLLSSGWSPARWLVTILVILYTMVIFIAGIQMGIKNKDISLVIGLPMAIATIHLSWGSAFLWGLVARPRVNEPER
jgi:hypothetical protein